MFGIFKRQTADTAPGADIAGNGTSASISTLTKLPAVRSAIALVERSFQSARVFPRELRSALTPQVMGLAARSLMTNGEAVFLLDVDGGAIRVYPTQSHTVYGNYREREWTYDIDLPGATQALRRENVPAASILHFRVGATSDAPYRGVSPLFNAYRAVLKMETSLMDEAGRVRNDLIFPAQMLSPAAIDIVENKLAKAPGRAALMNPASSDVPSTGTASVGKTGADFAGYGSIPKPRN